MDIIKHFKDNKRKIDTIDIARYRKAFPNLEFDAPNVWVLDNDLMVLSSDKDLCHIHECKSIKYQIDIFNKWERDLVDSIEISSAELKEDICAIEKYSCKILYKMLVRYNCIGLALGVLDWLDTNTFGFLQSSNLKIEEVIEQFIKSNKEIYKGNHEANHFDILDSLQLVREEEILEFQNNTVALYFLNGSLKHGARYIKDFNSWISKLGEEVPISHPSPLTLVGEAYGYDIYYLVPHTNNTCEELLT